MNVRGFLQYLLGQDQSRGLAVQLAHVDDARLQAERMRAARALRPVRR